MFPFSRPSLPSIRSKLIALVLASVLPLVLGYLAFVRDAGQREREHVARDAGTVARVLTAALDRELDSAEAAARVAAAWPNLGPATLDGFHDHLQALLRPEFPVTAFVLSGADGAPLMSTRLPAVTRPPAVNLAAVRKVLERGDAVVSGLHVPGVGQPEVVSAEVPVWRGGKVAYVLSAQIRPRRIADLLGAQQLPQGWVAEVFDSQGLVVARNIDHSRYIGGRMNAALAAALAGSPDGAVTLAGQAGEPDWYSVYAKSDRHGWTVAVTYPEDAARALLGHTLPATVTLSLALLGLSVLLAWAIGGSIARPVRQLSGPAAALGRGEPLRLPPPTIREVGLVSDALQQVEGELQRYRSHLEQAVADRTGELERLNARVETVYATAPVGLCFLDRDLRFVMINDYLAAINAVPAADHIGRTLPELFGETGASFEQAYHRVRETMRPLRDIETSGTLPSAPGTVRSWLSSYYPVFGAARELVGINAVVIEITERKLQEEQNRDNQEMFRVLFEASGDAQALLAYNANFISANPAAASLFGYDSVEEFVNLSPASASPEFQPNGRRSADVATELMRRALDEGGAQFEWVHRRRDGSNFHADVKLTALDVGGRGIMQVTIRDISARVAADAALRATSAQLREREHFIRTVTDNLPALVSYWDADARLRFANRPCLDWLGCSEEDALGRHAHDLIAPEHMACFAPYLDGVLAGRPQRFECELPTPAGQPQREAIHVWGSYLPDLDADGRVRGAYKLHMNVTDLKRTESRLVLALGQAEQAARAKNEFLGNMSHEIRTPLNAIMGLARVLEEAPLGPRERGHIAHIQNASKSLLALLSDLLDYARIESSELALERVPFRLDAVLQKVAAQLAPAAWNKGLEPVFAVAPGLPEQLLGDPLRLEQVLLALVANAVKFTDSGEVVLAIELLRQGEACVRLRFAVRDTGIGIAPAVQQHIFEPFTQGDSSISRAYGGAGLGLPIARRLAGLMGGELALDSAAGAGACFHFTLEFGIAEAGLPGGDDALRVLVADDNASAGAALAAQLAGFGWQAVRAAGGAEALALLRAAPRFDLAFVDAAMPGLDGPALLALAQGDPALALPPAALLAADPDGARRTAQAAGVAQPVVLAKPFTRTTLRATVAELRGGADAPTLPTLPTLPALSARLAGLRVLVVEDNEVNQEVARQVLLHAGAQVELAANGRSALDLLGRDSAFDAVLMDLQMPVMNGFEATAAIRAMGLATLPVVAMTANAMDEDRERALDAGMDAHLPKPIDVDALVATLRAVTGRGEAAAPALPRQSAAALPPLPGIDLQGALSRFGGNHAAFVAVFQRFAATQAGAVDEIRSLATAGDAEGALQLTHRLRGVAGNLGAAGVATQALCLEGALRGADQAGVTACLAALDAAMASVLAGAVELDQVSVAAVPATTTAPVRRDALARLLDLLQNNNMKAITSFEALRPALAGSVEANDMAELANAVGLLRFEQAARLVRAILEAKGDA
ncbi:MAG: PAS domain-containing protein [Pseudomonadota bacterium]